MRKIFITGGSGFVGGHLINRSLGKWQVSTNYYQHKVDLSGCDWVQLDLRRHGKVAKVLDQVRPDVVIHQAAMSNLDECEKHPHKARATNVNATLFLAEWCQKASVRLVFLSSDMVFNGEKGNYYETDPVGPLGLYAEPKVESERLIRECCRDHIIIRTALVYGKPVGGGTSFTEWMENRLRQDKEIQLYTDQYRTPVLVNNLAEVLLELAQGDFVGTLNVGGPDKTDRFSFGQKFCRIGGFDETLLIPIAMKSGLKFLAPRPRDLSLDVSKAKSILKTRLLGIDEGLKAMFLDNSKKWHRCT